MMEELERLLEAREIPFDAQDRKIMCYAHVIDLSSGRIIKGLSEADTHSDSESNPATDWHAGELPNLSALTADIYQCTDCR